MVFYKTATVSLDKLTFLLDVTYLRENRIDVGGLKAELFTNVFEKAKHNVFEHVENKLWCLIYKRPGGNFKCSRFLL